MVAKGVWKGKAKRDWEWAAKDHYLEFQITEAGEHQGGRHWLRKASNETGALRGPLSGLRCAKELWAGGGAESSLGEPPT